MESGIKRTQHQYTFVFKLWVVNQIEKGQLTLPVISMRIIFKYLLKYSAGQWNTLVNSGSTLMCPDGVRRKSWTGLCRDSETLPVFEGTE